MDRHTQTHNRQIHKGIWGQTQTGKMISDSWNRQTEDGRHREHGVENSNLNSLQVEWHQGEVLVFLSLVQDFIIGESELINNAFTLTTWSVQSIPRKSERENPDTNGAPRMKDQNNSVEYATGKETHLCNCASDLISLTTSFFLWKLGVRITWTGSNNG